MPWMSYLGEANFVKPICTTCKDKDLCNDEQDEGDLPDIGTGIGGGNGGGSMGLKGARMLESAK